MSRYVVYLFRTLHALTRPFIVIYFSLVRNHRVRVAVRYGGRILVVKTSFSSQRYAMPGGGIHRGEEPIAAACRELLEETGIQVAPENMNYLGDMVAHRPAVPFHFSVFECEISTPELPRLPYGRQVEIIERRWLSLDAVTLDDNQVIAWYRERISA